VVDDVSHLVLCRIAACRGRGHGARHRSVGADAGGCQGHDRRAGSAFGVEQFAQPGDQGRKRRPLRGRGPVDGRRISFLVDTGASQIALRESDAARLGIHPTPRDYKVKIHTANGIGRAALVQLRMVEVGNIVVRDLPALVSPDEALGVNLLGMSFLSRVRWTHERGKLILEQ
jgi:clan AA aspartic protease (TIGR02281 family)